MAIGLSRSAAACNRSTRGCCVALIRQLARDGAYGEAADVARRALRADPYREQMVRHYVGLLTLDDQRLEALRYFVQWSDLLKTELGVAPMPATLELISLIKSAETAEDFANLVASPHSQRRAVPKPASCTDPRQENCAVSGP